jgi:TonB-dependent vitamin B12 receptor
MRFSSSFIQSSILVLLISVTVARAQGPSVFFDDVTVTATGVEEETEQIPLAVKVIQKQEMEEAQEESVADLLRRSPGLAVMRAGDEGSAASLFTRGTDSDHTLALFDGVRLNSPYFGGYDWSLLPSTGLDRIEVARGPFSALWGSDAIGGVVNVLPSRAAAGTTASLFGEGGSDSWQRLEGTVGWSGKGLDLFASGFQRRGEGELENSDFDNRQFLADMGWSWGQGSRLSVLVQDLRSDIGIPLSNPVSPTPNRRQTADQRLVAVPLKLRVAEGWKVELLASQVERDLEFLDPDDPFGFTQSSTAADTLQGRLASHHSLGQHILSWGAEWREDEVTASSSFGVSLDGQKSQVRSLFAQDVWQMVPTVKLIAGLRWDDADESGSEVSPRVALGWGATDEVEVRASYGEGFRQPSVGELYYPFSGNPDLEAERSRSLEAGLTWKPGRDRLQLNLFWTEIDNLIEFDYASYAFANLAEASIRGAEAAWDRPMTPNLLSSLQGTWLNTEDVDGQPLLRRPEWSGSWTLYGSLGERWRGDVTLFWVGARDDVDAVTFERIELPSHLTANLALAYAVWRQLEVTGRVQNLADKTYEEVAGYPAPGRRFNLGLRWKM